jgi:Cdc6-like AAA superfamily ATPase
MELSHSMNAILPVLAVKDGLKGKDIRDVVKQLFLIDAGTKFVPFFISRLMGGLLNRRKKALTDSISDVEAKEREKKLSSIEIFRLFDKEHGNDIYDALMWRLCDLPQTKHLRMSVNGYFVIANKQVIRVDQEIYARQNSVVYDDKKAVQESCVEVFSYSIDLLELKHYLNDLLHKYDLHRNNQLGQTLYYFDEIPLTLPHHIDGSVNYNVAPKAMSFTMSKLYTNKSMDNVYGSAMDIVRKRVRFFINNKKWYQDKGVPHTLGIMLYGEPGCGKTSMIKALSRECQRHVFNIKLSDYTTVSQISNLFFNERVCVVKDGANNYYNIPIDKRVIVLEDIDCLSKIFAAREAAAADDQVTPEIESYGFNNPMFNAVAPLKISQLAPQQVQHSQKLTLSYFLNVLDGVLETPGRIVILTSNHPEKLDPALIRPGRVDLKVHFQRCTREDIREMISKITGECVTAEDLSDVPDMVWTPAEVTQKIFELIDEPVSDIIKVLKKN